MALGGFTSAATEVVAKALGGRRSHRRCAATLLAAADVDAPFTAAVDAFGALDVMVNNAGITRDATMRTMTEDQFDEVISVHLKGTWNGTRMAAAYRRGDGVRRRPSISR